MFVISYHLASKSERKDFFHVTENITLIMIYLLNIIFYSVNFNPLEAPLHFFTTIRGVAAVKFLVGQKKSRGLYFFPFGQKIIMSWAKKNYLVGPKLIHST